MQAWNLKYKTQISTDVIFEIKKLDNSHSIFSLSSGAIGTYDISTQQLTSMLQCHNERIGNFVIDPYNPALIYTCSQDATIKLIDLRSASIASFLKSPKCKPLNCISQFETYIISGSDVSAGESSVDLWDLRNGSLIKSSSDLHTDDITSVDFCMSYNKNYSAYSPLFVTASVDGLVNVCSLDKFDEEGAECVLNFSTSIAKTSSANNFSSVFSGTEEYSVFDLESGEILHKFGSIKNYSMDCLVKSCTISNELFLFTGSYSGDFYLNSISLQRNEEKIVNLVMFCNGHLDCVRDVYLDNNDLIVSAGDDGCICFWRKSL